MDLGNSLLTGSTKSTSESSEITPQVCDRCRIKKVRCDGVLPSCANCITAKVECIKSVRLQRKTKPRRYVPSKDESGKRLKSNNEPSPVSSSDYNPLSPLPASQSQASHLSTERQPVHLQPASSNSLHSYTLSTDSTQPRFTHGIPPQRPQGPVIKHLGRLVPTETGVDRFAGTTTGVHFLRSVEQKYQQLFHTSDSFPENVFTLHMIPQPESLYKEPSGHAIKNNILLHPFGLSLQTAPYWVKIERFQSRWLPLFPFLILKQLRDDCQSIFDCVQRSDPFIDEDRIVALYRLHLILAIDAWDDADTSGEGVVDDSSYHYKISQQLYFQVVERGDIATIQSLLLLSQYLQLSGKHSLLIQINGVVVRLAQSLGLHRNTRRFKFHIGELELRNRLWWCVFNLDMISSINYGLPKIIDEADVDSDMPSDSDIEDINATSLPRPLPGEATRFSLFISYIRLSRIMHSCTKQLYTTTQRRGGIEKIKILDREVHVWEDHFTTTFGHSPFNPSETQGNQIRDLDNNQDPLSDDERFMIPYLQVLGNVSLLMIHQPALTFGPEAPQYEISLNVCAQSSANIMVLLNKNRTERRLCYLQPIGPRLYVQAAMMCLYHSWHLGMVENHISSSFASTFQSQIPTAKIITLAINLLELQLSEYRFQSSQGQCSTASDIISSTISTLQMLSSQTHEHERDDSINMSGNTSGFEDIAIEQSQPTTAFSQANDDFWRPSTLGNLNQLDMLEWSTELAPASIDPYMLDFQMS